jgi:ABC-2 type transport system ATP-binding protein
VFFSTHILADVERICDTVAILDQGRVVAQAPIDELKARYGASKMLIEVGDGADELAEAMRRETWAASVERDTNGTIMVSIADEEAAARAVPAMVAARGLALKRMEAGEMGLEEVFVQLVGGGER